MRKLSFLVLIFSGFWSSAFSQYIGIGTENPQAMLDINGDVVFRTANLTVEDSLTLALDVNTDKFSCYRLSGADSSFALGGITAGMDGRIVTLINTSGFTMALHYEDTSAAPENRIVTGNQQNLILDDMGMVTLQYDTSIQKWLVNSSNQVAQESVWDTTGSNIYFENYVGIGTEEPTTPLSIETSLNEPGFSHMAVSGIDSVKMESTITDTGASIGTSSEDLFSLNAGGTGKLHIWPDGRVVIGDDPDPLNFGGINHPSRTTPPEAKLTMETPLSSTGWVHVAGTDSIIVDESIGGVSASLGTLTNHSFRLKTAGLGRLHVWYDGRVHIGSNTQAPVSQFTVHTPNLSYGLAHVGGDGQILASRMGGPNGSATFGTYTPTHFRLICNGDDALNIISPSLNVGIGIDFPTEKFTVQTPAGNFGISHRSNEGIFLATHIGQVSASIGTHSNHNFRLVTNGLSRLNITYDGKVGIGTTNPIHLFEVNGTMRSKEVIVETANWPDYVFDKT